MIKRIGHYFNVNPHIVRDDTWIIIDIGNYKCYNQGYEWQIWIEDNIEGYWDYFDWTRIAFSNKEDAILFKLIWD